MCHQLSLAFTSTQNRLRTSRAFRRIDPTAESRPHTKTITSLCLSPDVKVLTVGDALLDCIANDDARGFTVEEMVEAKKWTAFPGGAPANVATACCKLGTKAAYIGCLGQDEDGDKLEALLKETGVDTSLVQRDESMPTRRVMVTRSMEGDREFGGFYEGRDADGFADCNLDLPQDDDDDAPLFANIDWVVSSTLSLAFPQSGAAVREIVRNALEQGARLYVDVNWRPVFWPDTPQGVARSEIWEFCQQAKIVKMTDEEAEWLMPGVTPEMALADPQKIHQLFFPDAFALLVTAGEKGAAYSFFLNDGTCSGKIEPFSVPVVETTGAGDAFSAGFLHALSKAMKDSPGFFYSCNAQKKKEIHELIKFAAAVGALTCTNEGAIAAQPTYEQVQAFLNNPIEVDAEIVNKI
ncbi:unnamed protein product [Cylindrotheca closterium]|uniref:Carbohydrate kinase PfkB domain-containing protein n=1 Tax=Cylindrotheca closterium TaxID=2856 RepID=A0AAD2FQ84_9STRA|nr:unnamed protein product [Cylindrotheca closterium]